MQQQSEKEKDNSFWRTIIFIIIISVIAVIASFIVPDNSSNGKYNSCVRPCAVQGWNTVYDLTCVERCQQLIFNQTETQR